MNRILYPHGIKQKLSELAMHIRKTDAAVSLVTAHSRKYYVYRYKGNLNGIENAMILITYLKDTFFVTSDMTKERGVVFILNNSLLIKSIISIHSPYN
ncbi:MAG: hypothetical protein K2H91_10470, partial [Lachnospiraceae bacterium]|nr:hypothetical protein [Lachnospiraceae bacterium]